LKKRKEALVRSLIDILRAMSVGSVFGDRARLGVLFLGAKRALIGTPQGFELLTGTASGASEHGTSDSI